jgi:hypothetical protein
MIRGAFTAIVACLVVSTFDQHFAHGVITDTAISILRQLLRSFG